MIIQSFVNVYIKDMYINQIQSLGPNNEDEEHVYSDRFEKYPFPMDLDR